MMQTNINNPKHTPAQDADCDQQAGNNSGNGRFTQIILKEIVGLHDKLTLGVAVSCPSSTGAVKLYRAAQPLKANAEKARMLLSHFRKLG